ncbi:hypothetical protein V5799_015266 [Amblyomma americanum]|uniref:sulfite oxidase n=1 Tax=Amblyomma americanum TaxID=6943 RepID=A0AAQ4E0N1_AMBAM
MVVRLRCSPLARVLTKSAWQSALYRAPIRRALACRTASHGETNDDEYRRSGRAWAVLGGGISLWLLSGWGTSRVHAKQETKADEAVDGLPVYSAAEVAKHDRKETRIWISFRCGVYDVTDFVDEHPGGDKILLGAGGGIDPFWNIYAVHKTPEILALLETFRIGNLAAEDVGAALEGIEDPYLLDPKRHPSLKPASVKPFNAEPPLSTLADNYKTPNELFYVRNHMPVPDVDPEDYVLEIEDPDGKCHYLTLDEIKTKFPKVSVTSVIQCAGSRRSEQNKIKKVKGLDWGPCAIGNATWSGARLVDVLRHFGVDLSDERIQHIVMEGLDTDPTGMPYGSSFPAHKALDPKGDVLLAYEMNGQTLPRDHGFPVRAIAPGIVGARNVKWLARIQLSPTESNSHWQQKDYKEAARLPTCFQTLQASAHQLTGTRPGEGDVVTPTDGKIHVKGYAWSGGGRKVVRVDVSADGGQNWTPAELQSEDTSLYRAWAWTLWKLDLPVPPNATELEIVCKAVDSSYNSQPEGVAGVWNLRGVLNNAWYRVHVKVKQPGK